MAKRRHSDVNDQGIKENLRDMKDMLKLLCEKVDNNKCMKEFQRRLVFLFIT